MSFTIGSIICIPSNPMIGESVLIDVQPAVQPFDPAFKRSICIDGIPGTRRYVQFIRTGRNTIRVQADGPNGTEEKSTVVQVQTPTSTTAPTTTTDAAHLAEIHPSLSPHLWPQIGVPLLQVAHLPQQHYKVGLAVGQAPQLALNSGVPTLRSRSLFSLPPLEIPGAGRQPIYIWDLDNGSTLSSFTPSIQHDFSNSINPLIEHQSFNISVSSAGRKVTRTLTFTNMYAVLKRSRNELHPEASASGFAIRTATGFSASLSIKNPEGQSITLTARRFIPIFANSSQTGTPGSSDTISPSVSIPPKQLFLLPINATFAHVPRDSIGFGVFFSGRGASGETVRVNAHFDLDPKQLPPPRTSLAGLPNLALDSIKEGMVRTSRSGLTLSELRATNIPSLASFMEARPQMSNDYQIFTLGRSMPGIVPRPGLPLPHPSSPTVAVGEECDPDNLPSNLADGFVCQATTETRVVITPGRFMNARKGDIVLAAGGNGLIGGLLTRVDHPQFYSHSGIMTANYDQITHCTASEDRMQDYPVGSIPLVGSEPTDGFRPDIVKYGWPGTVTQTVENSVHGEPRLDPESNKPYNLQGFDGAASGATISGVWHIIPPVVVKPDPMIETDVSRSQLHKVADDAVAHTGKFHYRFYCYSDPTIEPTTVAPAEGRWATGTSPGVCSGFIWNMMKRNNMHLQGAGATVNASDFTPAQIAAGAKAGPATPDGLFLYSAAERERAAHWLHDQIYDQATNTINQKAGIFGGAVEWFTKLAAHVSNEFLNAFARDRVQTDDEDTGWASTVDANAVSPDNIMLWNGPSANPPGPYGYVEPLIYREPRYDLVTVSKWRQVQLVGTLSGRVTFQGKPVIGTTITLYDGKSAGSDGNGYYTIPNVPYGTYIAKAEKEQDGLFLSVNLTVTIEGEHATQDIALAPPTRCISNSHA